MVSAFGSSRLIAVSPRMARTIGALVSPCQEPAGPRYAAAAESPRIKIPRENITITLPLLARARMADDHESTQRDQASSAAKLPRGAVGGT